MTKEITEGNKLIAEFMGGYVISTEKYESPHGSRSSGTIEKWRAPNYSPYSPSSELGYFHYDTSWDWIMPVIDKINGMGKEYNFAIFKTYVSLTIEKSSKVYKDFSFAYSEYITATQTGKEAAFKLLVKFVKWENENLLKSELAIPL